MDKSTLPMRKSELKELLWGFYDEAIKGKTLQDKFDITDKYLKIIYDHFKRKEAK